MQPFGRMRLGRFIMVAFGWSWPLDLLALRVSPSLRHVVLGLGMWGPALGALAAIGPPWRTAPRALYRPRGFAGRHRPLAIAGGVLLPPAVLLVSVVLTVRTGMARWNPEHPRPAALFAIIMGGTLLSPLLNFPFALGEELGWRGFFFPTLAERWGEAKALALTGVVWGVWHTPLVLAGFNYPGHPWLAIPMMIGLTSMMNLGFVALARLGGTVAAPTLAHGATNGIAGLSTMLLVGGNPVIISPAGVLAWVPLGVAGLALLAYERSFRSRGNVSRL